jgi:hypothetical protein
MRQIREALRLRPAARLIVPDQVRALVKRPDTDDPLPNRAYEEFASHYGCAPLAARPEHPRDKPKVEGALLLVKMWILARLRNRRFFSLVELNAAITELIADLNLRPFQKLPGCRPDAFLALDAPALSPLPTTRCALGSWRQAKVNIDYHVEFEGHDYSVPHRLVGSTVEIRAGAGMLEIFHANQRVACHALDARCGHPSGNHRTYRALHRLLAEVAAA